MLPDWLPNIHPLIVHFPIALLVTALLFDLFRLIKDKPEWLHKAAGILYAVGTIGLGAAFYSGKQAVTSVLLAGDASVTAATHEDWALYTLIYFIMLTALRLWFWIKGSLKNRSMSILFAAAGLTGVAILWQTAEYGSAMVYRHGVAVQATEQLREENDKLQRKLALFREDWKPQLKEDGSWSWLPGPESASAVEEVFNIQGSGEFSLRTDRINGRYHLSVKPSGDYTYLVIGENMKSVEGLMEINIEQFSGAVMLLHHFTDTDNYQYLKLKDDKLIQGQVLDGNERVLQSGSIDTNGWITLRLSAAGTHFYGYRNSESVTHTHGEEMQEGLTGFAFGGNGKLLVRSIEFNRLD